MKTQNYSVKITKKINLLSVHNEWVSNEYFLVHGKIYNADKTYYKRFKFVVWIDCADLWDCENDMPIPLKDGLENSIFCMVDRIHSFEDADDFFEACNATIEWWNDGLKRR